jgi:hypothetical protein
VPAAITTDQILARIKVRAQVPSTEGRVSDPEILALVDDLILSSLGREMYEADDGRWIKTAADVAITAGRSTYRIPSRAWAGGLDEAILVASSGALTQLEYVDRSDIWEWGTSTGVPVAYTIVGDVVQLLPTPASSGYSLRLRYLRRPSSLVTVAECARVASVASTVLTIASAPAAWDELTLEVDVIEAEHHGEALEDSVTVEANTGPTTLTRSSGTFATSGAYAVLGPSNTIYRTYVCEEGESCVVQVPDVCIPYIADLAARDVCVALGDMPGADRLASLAEQRRKEVVASISERSRQRPKIVPRNSPLRVSGSERRWFR